MIVFAYRMENILLKLKELMKEDNIEVAVFPPCEALQISLLRYLEGRSSKNKWCPSMEEDREGVYKGGGIGRYTCTTHVYTY